MFRFDLYIMTNNVGSPKKFDPLKLHGDARDVWDDVSSGEVYAKFNLQLKVAKKKTLEVLKINQNPTSKRQVESLYESILIAELTLDKINSDLKTHRNRIAAGDPNFHL